MTQALRLLGCLVVIAVLSGCASRYGPTIAATYDAETRAAIAVIKSANDTTLDVYRNSVGNIRLGAATRGLTENEFRAAQCLIAGDASRFCQPGGSGFTIPSDVAVDLLRSSLAR